MISLSAKCDSRRGRRLVPDTVQRQQQSLEMAAAVTAALVLGLAQDQRN